MTAKKKFVHLHLHSEYSLLDGMSKISDLLAHVKEHDMDTVALTDHGVMYGAVEFYKKCKKEEVKPIIGMEAYTTTLKLGEKPKKGKARNYHLLLLAKNHTGYKNLMKLTSIAHLEGYYYRPRITRDILKKHSEGLVATSACAASEFARTIVSEGYDEAKKIAEWFLDVFKDDYYLEIQRHNIAEHLKNATHPDVIEELTQFVDQEKIINEGSVKLSRELGIPLIATNDAHYIKKENATAQDALVCIATGKDVSETKRLRFIDVPEYYVKSPDQMYDLFGDLDDACKNTLEVAQKCEVEIEIGKWYFPKMQLPKGKSARQYFMDEIKKGLKEKYPEITPEIKKRAAYEIKVISEKGYIEYFLIYKDMADWAKERHIPINTRGSVAGSIVSYALGITTVDPIRYLLPFERFLNPFRPSAPDIDMDISDVRREDMIEFLIKKYGHDKVAQICTFGRMLARGGVRDIARVLGYPYATGDKIAKLIPEGSQGFPMFIDRALDESKDLLDLYNSDSDAKTIIDLAREIEGNARHVSVHAAGLVISPTELTDFTPVQNDKPGGDKIITQYEMHAVEDVGLVKLDVLGIRNLTILEGSLTWVRKTRNKTIDITKIPLDDKKTFKMLSDGGTFGVFQLGGAGITRCLTGLKPEKIEDIFLAIALFRPGPMANIEEYIARKEGKKEVTYYHPKMEKFLDKSLGVLVYQDDLLYTALEVAGYDWEEVDKFRKAVGKKIPEEMAKQHKIFVKGCIEHSGMTKQEAEGLWELFEPFQGYGFNKAHTASYGMVSYRTAYMKANYPVEYMCSLLTAESNDTDKISQAVAECKRMEIIVLPPDINESDIEFNVVKNKDSFGGQAIRFGLSAIKNVGKAAIEAILEERNERDFSSFVDFIKRVDGRKVNKRVLESLIKVGAMNEFGSRKSLLENMEDIRSKVGNLKTNTNQQGLFGEEEIHNGMKDDENLNLRESEFGKEELEKFEQELMGFSLSARPAQEVIGSLSVSSTHRIEELIDTDAGEIKEGEIVTIAAILTEIRVVTTKKSNKEMAFARVDDGTGAIDLVIFPQTYAENRKILVESEPLLVSGKLDFREENPSILVDEMKDKQAKDSENDELFVKLPDNIDPKKVRALRDVLVEHPGNQKVTLMFGSSRKKLTLPIRINWSEVLARKISAILD